MDPERFDGIVRSLAEGGSRRRVLRGLAGAALGAVLASRGDAGAARCQYLGEHCDARRPCCSGKRCVAGRCRCRAGRPECGGSCPDLRTNDYHCGRCDRRCVNGRHCEGGECVVPPPGSVRRRKLCARTADCSQAGGPVFCAVRSDYCGGPEGCPSSGCPTHCLGTERPNGEAATCGRSGEPAELYHCDCAYGTLCSDGRCRRA